MKRVPLDPELDDLVTLFGALGNPARIRILEILAERPESIVADIVERLPLAQSTVSQHLAVLQETGLIYDDRAGSGRCCRLDTGRLAHFSRSLVGWTIRLAATAGVSGPEERCEVAPRAREDGAPRRRPR